MRQWTRISRQGLGANPWAGRWRRAVTLARPLLCPQVTTAASLPLLRGQREGRHIVSRCRDSIRGAKFKAGGPNHASHSRPGPTEDDHQDLVRHAAAGRVRLQSRAHRPIRARDPVNRLYATSRGDDTHHPEPQGHGGWPPSRRPPSLNRQHHRHTLDLRSEPPSPGEAPSGVAAVNARRLETDGAAPGEDHGAAQGDIARIRRAASLTEPMHLPAACDRRLGHRARPQQETRPPVRRAAGGKHAPCSIPGASGCGPSRRPGALPARARIGCHRSEFLSRTPGPLHGPKVR